MMGIPFTADQFLDVFRQYNEAVFPVQFLLVLVAVAALYLTIRPSVVSDRWISGIAALITLPMILFKNKSL
ncbi:MAG: hypothetical protein IPL92_08965 [Saprospiraceae bacterium]|nr:hypothetical protein [Candidatus Opimibacter iunctus]